jgi:hypothetical protein
MFIRLDKDTITPELQRLMREVSRPRSLMEAGAKTIQVEISKHLRKLQDRGNAKGWPPQKFFAGKPDSVEKHVGISRITNTSAEVTIADPRFVHRIEGGTVTPKRAKNLAIPLTAEAYAAAGKGSIKESMPGLKLVKFPRGLYLVKEVGEKTTRGATGRRKYGAVQRLRVFPMFKLVKSVTHNPHPEEMPDAAALGAAARDAMTRAAQILLRATA